MAHYWFIITLWLGTASLQFIDTASPASDGMLDPLDYLQRSSPYPNYFNLPSARNEFESFQNDANVEHARYYEQEQPDFQRKRRTVEEDRQEEITDRRWEPNLEDLDKTLYRNEDKDDISFIDHNARTDEENNTDRDSQNIDKRSFSPWGGKRGDRNSIEDMWTWKRAQNIREPSMPKRVRFSPWGGKRSGQMIYKPGTKGAKVIFSASVPELTRIVSNYSPNNDRLNLGGFQFIPAIDKRHPIKFFALSTKAEDRILIDELPFKAFIQSLPRVFKPGHTYSDINLKKDGKRKVKFSAWGGKRSPPIIGPIWTPAPQDVKESTLDSIVLIRNSQDNDAKAL